MSEFEYYILKSIASEIKERMESASNKFYIVFVESDKLKDTLKKYTYLMNNEDKQLYLLDNEIVIPTTITFKFINKQKFFSLINNHFLENNKKIKKNIENQIKEDLSEKLLWSDIPLYMFSYIYSETEIFDKTKILSSRIDRTIQELIKNGNGIFNYIIEQNKEELMSKKDSCENVLKILYTFFAQNSYDDFARNPKLIIENKQLFKTLILLREIFGLEQLKKVINKLNNDGSNHIYDITLSVVNGLSTDKNGVEKIKTFKNLLNFFVEKEQLHKAISTFFPEKTVAKKRL